MLELQRLGWDWRDNGAIVTVVMSGKTYQVFVPIRRLWITFENELKAVGCPSAAAVGCVGPSEMAVGYPGELSVGGMFDFVKKAVKKAGSLVKKVVPKAVQRAASKVVATAKKYVNKVPVLGSAVNAFHSLALMPVSAASQLVQGKRIDRIAIDQFKSAIKNTKTLAPYAQTVLSFVPGVGQGLSAGIGGALALAEGQTITQAMETAVKSALPGGPLAQAAFSVASGVMQGKPVDQIAVNALPISPQQKVLLMRGLTAAKALANGQRVEQVIIDQALQQLPPQVAKAVQIGAALGQAKVLQGAGQALHLTKNAAQMNNTISSGLKAAQLFQRGNRSPAVVSTMAKGLQSKRALGHILTAAQRGHAPAQNFAQRFGQFQRLIPR